MAVLLAHTHHARAQSSAPLTNFPTFNGPTYAIVVSGGVIYVGGDFTQATDAPANGGATVTRNRVAAISEATGALLAWNPNANNSVIALAVSGTTVYAGGGFTTIGGQARSNIAALDAATGLATAWNPNASGGGVVALAVSGTTVYAGGLFTTIGGQARNRIAALDAGTGLATAWNPNANDEVRALAVSGTTVYAGGLFTTIGGQARNRIAALDAGTGLATAWNPNASSTVHALAVSGTTVYVGGNFGTIGGQARNCIAALDAGTGLATAWNPNANSTVFALAVSGTTVYTGGDFSAIGGQTRNFIAALDAGTGLATAWNPNANNHAGCLALNGTTVYVGGFWLTGTGFTTIGGNPRQGFAAFGPPPSAVYTGTTFAEAGANNGTITVTQDVTLTNDTWVPAGLFTGGGTHYTATGVPAGLAIAINRISVTVARISFTGTAAAHQNVNDATVTLNFTNAALTGNNAAGVTSLNPASLTLDFNNNPTAAYAGTTFAEAGANDGTITVTRDVTLTGDTWVPAGLFTGGGTHYTATGVPAGLAIAINRISATVARVSFTGTAAAHANANDATVTLNFTNAALTSGVAAAVTGLNPASLTLDFNDPGPSAAYTGTTFAEAGANDGTITVTQDVTLTGDTWVPAGLFTGGGTHYTAAGVPAGLTIAINRISATVARISFTGTAVAHANANDATVTLNFTNAALTGNNAAAVGGLNPATLTIDFNDPAVIANQGITSFTPTSGGAGTTVVIMGSGFTGATAVSFGGVPAASFTVNSNTQITAVLGSGSAGTGGQQLVIVTAPGGVFSLGGFSLGTAGASSGSGSAPSGGTAQSAVIGGISPSSLGFGTAITVSGSGFTGATGLLIGGIAVTNFVVVNDNTITAVVGGVPVSDRIVLTGGAGATLDMSGLGLTYTRLIPPAIASVSPASLVASGDDASLTLSGFYFLPGARALVSERGANGQLSDALPLGVQSVNATQAVVSFAGIFRSPGEKVITLLNPDGQSSRVALTVVTGAAVRLVGVGAANQPVVFSTTASGRAFSVRLSGANIFRTVRAFLGDLPAQVTVPSSTEAIVEVPASANDIGGLNLVLRLQNSDGSSTTATLRIDRRPPPTITGVTLQSGGRLQVRGVNFLVGIRSALGNSALTLVSQDGDTQFTAQIPPSFRLTANSPTVSLTVQNSDGRSHGVLLPRSMFEADMATSSDNGVNTERTWENSSPALELAEIVAEKQLQSGSQELSVYPNPVEGELRIGGVGQRVVRLYDMRGGLVLEERTVNGVVNVAAVSAGAYMVVVEADGGRVLRQRVTKR